MKTITLNVDTDGYGIHEQAERLADSATEPTLIIKEFHGGNVQRVYSFQCASQGDEALAREYLQHLLDTHDRYYDYSDDYRVWQKGVSEWNHIQRVIKAMENRGFQYCDIYDGWNKKGEI